MQISPQIETAQFNLAPQFTVDPLYGESPYAVQDYESRSDEAPDGFAEILKRLMREDEPAETDSAALESSGGTRAEPVKTAAAEIEDGAFTGGDFRAGKTRAQKAAREEESAETDDMTLTLEETRLLFAVDRLLNAQPDSAPEEISPEEEAWLTGEIAPDAELLSAAGVSLEDDAAESGLLENYGEAAAQSVEPAGEAIPAKTAQAGEFSAETGFAPQTEKPETAKKTPRMEESGAARAFLAGAEQTQPTAQLAVQPEQKPQKAAINEKEGKSRLEEARSRDKKRGASLEVRDFRTGAAAESAVKGDSLRVNAAVESRSPDGAEKGEINLELRLSSQAQDAAPSETRWETKAGSALENMLARELHQNFNNDIVRHASIALRDSGEGAIRLALKPEALGNVKIRLEMAENKITGRIIVESEEALRAFEREIGSLEEAFRESGFDGANLEMSLAGNGANGAGQSGQDAQAARFMPDYNAASRYDAAQERVEAPSIVDFYQRETALINMFA